MDKKFPRVGIGVFIFKNKKFLIGQRKGAHGEGSWTVPGGHLDFGEKIEQGAKREVFEETGIKIKNVKIAGFTNDIFKKEGKHYITIWITSNWAKNDPRIKEPDKYLNMEWRTFNNLPKNLFLPWEELNKSDFYPEIKKLI